MIGTLQPGVAQGAAGEQIQGPVEGEPPAELPDAGVDAVALKNDRPVMCMADLDETPVAGEQNALFRMRLFDEIAIAAPPLGNCRAIAGNAQPAAEPPSISSQRKRTSSAIVRLLSVDPASGC